LDFKLHYNADNIIPLTSTQNGSFSREALPFPDCIAPNFPPIVDSLLQGRSPPTFGAGGKVSRIWQPACSGVHRVIAVQIVRVIGCWP